MEMPRRPNKWAHFVGMTENLKWGKTMSSIINQVKQMNFY